MFMWIVTMVSSFEVAVAAGLLDKFADKPTLRRSSSGLDNART